MVVSGTSGTLATRYKLGSPFQGLDKVLVQHRGLSFVGLAGSQPKELHSGLPVPFRGLIGRQDMPLAAKTQKERLRRNLCGTRKAQKPQPASLQDPSVGSSLGAMVE